MSTEHEEAAAGMAVVRDAVRAMADGGDGLSVVNAASPAEARWAAAYMLSIIQTMSLASVGDDPTRVGLDLKRRADLVDRDIVETQVALFAAEIERGDLHG